MTSNDLVQRIVNRVGTLLSGGPLELDTEALAGGPLELDTEALAGALRETLSGAVRVDREGRHYPGLDIARSDIQGRVRQPTAQASINRARSGGIRVRIDSDQDPEFWIELTLSADLLNRLGFVELFEDD